MSAHTPGPWHVGSSDASDYAGNLPAGSLYVSNDAENVICELDSCGVPLPRASADARLIAAAPDMLAALERLTHPAASDDDVEFALEVIAKAKGGAL